MANGKSSGRPKIVLTRKRRVRGKDYKADTIIATVDPAKGFSFDDVRKALLAGHAELVKG